MYFYVCSSQVVILKFVCIHYYCNVMCFETWGNLRPLCILCCMCSCVLEEAEGRVGSHAFKASLLASPKLPNLPLRVKVGSTELQHTHQPYSYFLHCSCFLGFFCREPNTILMPIKRKFKKKSKKHWLCFFVFCYFAEVHISRSRKMPWRTDSVSLFFPFQCLSSGFKELIDS